MLVLTRKHQEKIHIGDNITITILRMKGKAVRVGIEAPADVPVIRGELAFEAEKVSTSTAKKPAEAGPAPAGPGVGGRNLARHAGVSAEWRTDSNPNIAIRSGENPGTTRIQFNRVPREAVADVLPNLVGVAVP